VLASLTTNPARRLAAESGAVEVGGRGDLVIFGDDPRENARAFARPAVTVRNGRVVYRAAD
jgi:imidazolonepropionase-like amidohydrolase